MQQLETWKRSADGTIGVMINPDFRVEIHYSPTPEFPLP
jgi:hypothetical protein